MGPDDWMFLEDMRTERKMYCKDFVDNVWKAQMELKVAKQQKVQRLKQAKAAEEQRLRKVSWKNVVLEGDKEKNNQDKDEADDSEFITDADIEQEETNEMKKTNRKN